MVVLVRVATMSMMVSMRMSMVGTTAFRPRSAELLDGEDSAGGTAGGEDDVDSIDVEHDGSIDNGANADDGDDGGNDALDSREWDGVEMHYI